MDLGSYNKALQNAGRSVLGTNVKCVLCVRAVDSLNKTEILETTDEKNQISKETRSAINDAKRLNKKLLERAEKSLESGGSSASTYNDIRSDVENNGFIALEMQYNPSSIRLDTSAGRQLTYTGSADDINLKTRDAPVTTTLSCDLLFDNVNPMDAFMLNDNPVTGLSVGSIANTVAEGYLGYKKQEFSVQRQMEGLFSMISIPQARGVIFFWGSMSFRGLVTQIDSEYTMFNKKGAPVRGIVRLQIQQGQSPPGTGKKRVENYDREHWDKMFNKTFTSSTEGGIMDTLSKATNNSFLNLSL
ncbi:MAG: hypothetical protein K5770_17155 [Lachnospiraceae bacterium]|nr:hypothetical protein [Lachnospiraceae bacterium]